MMDKNTCMKYFEYEHMNENSQSVCKPIMELAQEMNKNIPDGLEKVFAMRKLLEAKDCFLRAAENIPQQ